MAVFIVHETAAAGHQSDGWVRTLHESSEDGGPVTEVWFHAASNSYVTLTTKSSDITTYWGVETTVRSHTFLAQAQETTEQAYAVIAHFFARMRELEHVGGVNS